MITDMPTLYQTTDMEATVNLMAARHHRVKVDAVYENRSDQRIRFRTDMLDRRYTDIRLASKQSSVNEWFIARSVGVFHYANDFPADGLLIVECPRSVDRLNDQAIMAMISIVYRPPLWDAHWNAHEWRHPSVLALQGFYRMVRGSGEHPGLEEAVGLPHSCILEDSEGHKQLRMALLPGKMYETIYRIILRMRPEGHDGLVWDAVKAQPKIDGAHVITSRRLWENVRFYRKWLGRMERAGYIEQKPALVAYQAWDLMPDWRKITRDNQKAEDDLREVIALVEGLPMYD